MAYAAILGQTGSSGILPQITIKPIRYTYTSVVLQNNETSKQFTATYDGSNWVAQVDEYGTYTITGTYSGGTKTATLDVEVNQEYSVTLGYTPVPTLNDNDWATISYASKNNLGESLWSVGDAKQVTLDGKIGYSNTFNNFITYVYIIGFNHNQTIQGQGITFGCFINSLNSGDTISITESFYSRSATNGRIYCNINHWGGNNCGGWGGCDLRYDFLGSTDVAPSGYGSVKTVGVTGNNPTSTCTSNPVPNTLMAALPSDLRAVMKPMTIYTDNVGGDSNLQTNVTQTIDYLPLLSEYEVQGNRIYANQYEQNYQVQYQYYIDGNSRVNYGTYDSSVVIWYNRSVYYANNRSFVTTTENGAPNPYSCSYSYGVSPIFMV